MRIALEAMRQCLWADLPAWGIPLRSPPVLTFSHDRSNDEDDGRNPIMPFKTRCGSHYHTTYGCHRAMEPCSTEGLEPCTDCCGRAGAAAKAGGAISPGIAGVPQEAITGEMLACEYGQDYLVHAAEYDNAASFIKLMGSAEDRARAARALSVGMAERDFEQRVMRDVDLIEGEVAMPEDVEAITAMVYSHADGAIRNAYRQQIREGLIPEQMGAGDRIDEGALGETIADRLEESGCVPWLSQSMREEISYGLMPIQLQRAFDRACSSLETRRGILPEHLPVATFVSDAGQSGMSDGQQAPDGRISIVQDSGTQEFPQITVVGKRLEPTNYGDGFDVGDIVTYDSGWSMTLPHFAFVMRRTPKTIETIDLPTVDTSSDVYGQIGSKRPVGIIDLSQNFPLKKSRMRKHGGFSIDGHWTHPWDGNSSNFNYMD